MSVRVTRSHRELAICAYWAQSDYREIHCGAGYVEHGDLRGIDPRIFRQAQALADIEAAARATRASAVEPGEAEHLERAAQCYGEYLHTLRKEQLAQDEIRWLERERIRRAKL